MSEELKHRLIISCFLAAFVLIGWTWHIELFPNRPPVAVERTGSAGPRGHCLVQVSLDEDDKVESGDRVRICASLDNDCLHGPDFIVHTVREDIAWLLVDVERRDETLAALRRPGAHIVVKSL